MTNDAVWRFGPSPSEDSGFIARPIKFTTSRAVSRRYAVQGSVTQDTEHVSARDAGFYAVPGAFAGWRDAGVTAHSN